MLNQRKHLAQLAFRINADPLAEISDFIAAVFLISGARGPRRPQRHISDTGPVCRIFRPKSVSFVKTGMSFNRTSRTAKARAKAPTSSSRSVKWISTERSPRAISCAFSISRAKG